MMGSCSYNLDALIASGKQPLPGQLEMELRHIFIHHSDYNLVIVNLFADKSFSL